MSGAPERGPDVDPWKVLRDIAGLYCVVQTTREEPMDSGDAIDTLAQVRELAWAALASAPGPRLIGQRRQEIGDSLIESWTLATERGAYAHVSREGTDPDTRITRVEIVGVLVARFEGRRRVALTSLRGRSIKATEARRELLADVLLRCSIAEDTDVTDYDRDPPYHR